MRRSTARAFACALVLAAVTAAAPPARAQAGWYATPSFSLTEEYDDNVFATPTGEREDFITRFSPGLKLGFGSATLTLEASASVDAEVYAEQSELSGAANRTRAGLAVKYLPGPLTTLRLDAAFVQTQTATELLVETGVELGRREATLLGVTPLLSYRFSPLTTGEASYTFRRGTIEDDPDQTTHEARGALTWQLAQLHTATVGYLYQIFETEGADTRTSHTATLGWTGQLGRQTTLTLQAGPRVSDGDVGPDILARIEYRMRYGAVSLAYARSEAVVLGRAGTVEAEGLLATLTVEPVPRLRLTLSPSVRRSSEDAPGVPETRVYGVGAAVVYELSRWVSVRAEYRFALQEEEGRDRIRHSVASLSLDFSYPVRFDD
ncbi:MAG: hypothetical protein HYV62_13975 [Candidatus Rokubacteria bacterium]|nr:hypothetical protein [Candidatus Rokubacteria bacterium]